MIAVDGCFSKRMFQMSTCNASGAIVCVGCVVYTRFKLQIKGCLVEVQNAIFPEQTAKVFKTQFAENRSLLPGYEYFLYRCKTLQTFLAVFK